MGAYVDASEVQAAYPESVYKQLFDFDGDGVVDTADVDKTILAVEADIDVKLGASHGAPLTGTIPRAIKNIALRMIPWQAVMFWPGNGTDKAPFRQNWSDAMRLLEDLAKDRGARLPAQIAEPEAGALSYVSAPTPVWAASANSAEADPDATSVNGTGGKYSGF